ncbi:MAG: KpsF/GutQ family sugar-phosphate isomerase [Planctomycetaceae bacterium]|nr:KpsF/GutQ family sugar-phosphate isomerase [Planctomycetaceae bacterium]
MTDVLSLGKQILKRESLSIQELAETLDERFLQAVYRILCCEGNVLVCGIGKAGLVGQKISATLSSTGTPSHFLHPAEAVHGDLGKIGKKDVMLILSQSGETEEIVRILPSIRQFRVETIAITASEQSTLGRNAHVVLPIGQIEEADSLGLAPSASTAVMIALGDALALTVSQRRRFRADHFAVFHPGGSLGRKLSRVDEHLRGLERCRIAPDNETIREVFVRHRISGRRSGAILLTGKDGKLSGIFTDSDLAKLFEQRHEHLIDLPIRMTMTSNPTAVLAGTRMSEAITIMSEKRISELPVVDKDGLPIGMIDITDVIAAFPDVDVSGCNVNEQFPPEKTMLKIA